MKMANKVIDRAIGSDGFIYRLVQTSKGFCVERQETIVSRYVDGAKNVPEIVAANTFALRML
jgi:hypothetical protein